MAEYFKYLVYGLIDPRTEEIRYVGKSTRGLARPAQHRNESSLRSKTHRACWIRSLKEEGLDFTVVVLGFSNPENLAEAERYWIAYGREKGWPLTNHTDGGEGVSGLVMTEETRLKMSEAQKGKAISSTTRRKISEARQGRPRPQDVRERISRTRLQRFKLDEALIQRLRQAYEVDLLSASEIGRVYGKSPQTVCQWLRRAGVALRTFKELAERRQRKLNGRF